MAQEAALVVAMAAVVLLPAACGGGSHSGPAGAGQGRLAQALAFSRCIRSHGVPNFPDPDSAGGFPMNRSQQSSDVHAFLSAKAACNHLYPNMGKGQGADPAQQAAQQRHALLFAACMRRHGVQNFPDDWSGNVGQLISAGIAPNSPQLNTALTKCGF